jgi:hypothetical protein
LALKVTRTESSWWRLRSCAVAACIAAATMAAIGPAAAADPIVGTWVGKGAHAGSEDQFNMRLTFVSPNGGISRYPDVPCGGMLAGDRKGDDYEYSESITFNGPDEKNENFCINGSVRLSVDGDTMKYEWSSNYDGQDQSSTGELHRQHGKKD